MPSPKATKAAEQYMRELREQFEDLPPETMAEMAKAYRQKVKGQLGGAPLTPPEIENNHQLLEQEVEEAEAAGLFDEEGETVSEEKGEARDVEEQPQPSDEAGESGNDEEDEETEEEPARVGRRNFLRILGGVGLAAAAGAGIYLAKDKIKLKEGPPGSKLFEEYEKLPLKEREMFVLKHVAAENMPAACREFVTIKAKGKNGTEVEFKAVKRPLAIGNSEDSIEIPLSGAGSMAAAELQGYTIPTAWMAKIMLYEAVEKNQLIPYITRETIAQSLGMDPGKISDEEWGKLQSSPQFILQRKKLLDEWIRDNKKDMNEFVEGHFKYVVNPIRVFKGNRKEEKLYILGGFDEIEIRKLDMARKRKNNYEPKFVQPKGGGRLSTGDSSHKSWYFDYGHDTRFIDPDSLRVNDKLMTLEEFHKDPKMAAEFNFQAGESNKRSYQYPPELEVFMHEQGKDDEEDEKKK